MRFRAHVVALLVPLTIVSAACTSSTSETTSSVTADQSVTTLGSSDTAGQVGGDTTTTTETPKSVLTAPEYQIVDRVADENEGDTVVVLLDPDSYEALTDIDLYDLIAEVVELFPPVAVVHVVDDAAAANIVGNPDASEADREAIVDHYLAKLDSGYKITYLGPFASSGTAVLGS